MLRSGILWLALGAFAQQPPTPDAVLVAGRAIPPSDRATEVKLRPVAVAPGPGGFLYIGEIDRVWRVDAAGKISVLPSPPGGYALVGSLAAGNAGNLYVADMMRVWRLAPDGSASLVMTGAATSGSSNEVNLGLALDTRGNLFVADRGAARVWKIAPDGTRTAYAGTGISRAPLQDERNISVFALSYDLYAPGRLALDPNGNLFVADNYWVHRIAPDGTLTHVWEAAWFVRGMAATAGALYLASPQLNAFQRMGPQVVAVEGGTPKPVAGTGQGGFSEGCEPGRPILHDARKAALAEPVDIAFDAAGNLFIADPGNGRVRRVSPDYSITTVAGSASGRFGGDGGAATSAFLAGPAGLAFDAAGNLYIADRDNNRIRRVTKAGVIETVAGSGASAGEDPACVQAGPLLGPEGVGVDREGTLYIADTQHHRVLRLAGDGTLVRVAGTGERGQQGDGLPALEAQLNGPRALAVDSGGNLWINETYRLMKVGQTGILSAVSWGARGVAADDSGNIYYSEMSRLVKHLPDGGRVAGPPDNPTAIAASRSGAVFSTGFGYLVRRLDADCSVTEVSGRPAPDAMPFAGIAVSPSGDIYLSDAAANLVWRIPAPAGDRSPRPQLDPVSVLNGASRASRTIMVDGTIRVPPGVQIPTKVPFTVNALVAPGQLAYIKGACLAPMDRVTAPPRAGSYPTSLGGTSVTFDDIPAPLLSAQSDEILAVVPYEIAGRDKVRVTVTYKGASVTVPTDAAASSPGLFRSAAGDGLLINEDGSVNSKEFPAPAGSVVSAWGTGEGQTDPPGTTGAAVSGTLRRPLLPVTLKVRDTEAEVLFAGPAPGLVGVLQVNFRVPPGEPGLAPLTLTIGEASAGSPIWVR